jgi:hypothetical protein
MPHDVEGDVLSPSARARLRADRGRWSEMRFDLMAGGQRGLVVWKPINPSCKYDRVIDLDGRFLRVQIKTVEKTGRMSLGSQGGGGVKKRYAPDAFDLLVGIDRYSEDVYVVPMDVVQRFERQAVNVSHLADYKNAWHLLSDMQLVNTETT